MSRNDDPTVSAREKDHYDCKAGHILYRITQANAGDLYRRDRDTTSAGTFRHPWLDWVQVIRSFPDSDHPLTILDLGCGQGFHTVTIQLERPRDRVIGIDISSPALEIGNLLASSVIEGNRPSFLEMDAHHLAFPDESFDGVSDFGSLSSLEFDRAIAQIHRVLKPGGIFVAVETLGHNPLLNLMRRISVLRGRRTRWAADHIFTEKERVKLATRFADVTCRYYAITTLLYPLIPFRSARLLGRLERLDQAIIARLPCLRRHAFKIVCVARKQSALSPRSDDRPRPDPLP